MVAMPVVWSDAHRLHEPGGEVWVGIRTPGTEVPARAEAIREALEDARFVDAEPHADDAVLAVHDAGLVDSHSSAWTDWEAAGLDEDPGQHRVVPYVFLHPGLIADRRPARPANPTARAGH